ncbi:hypothetical protein ABIE51_001537 [Lysobacter sp. OAE881]|uniref:hypothetical protein n=1 Tax=Lysobacter sp. OAE881 TaxID=2663813 RepID=UPI0017897D53
MKKVAMYVLACLLVVPLLGTLALMRLCGRSAPDRGRSCTPDQTIEFLHEAGDRLAGITTLQLAVLSVVVLYVACVVWLWKRKRSGSADRGQ